MLLVFRLQYLPSRPYPTVIFNLLFLAVDLESIFSPIRTLQDFVFYVCFLVYILAVGISNELTDKPLVELQLLQSLGVIGLILGWREERIMAWWAAGPAQS